jgi:hypothetical protein
VKGLSLHGPRSAYNDAENRKWLRDFLAEELKKKGLDPEKFLGDVLF